MRLAALVCAIFLATLQAAAAQSVIAQPLPPPPGAAGAPVPARPVPARPAPVRPPPPSLLGQPRVPLVRPARTPSKKPLPHKPPPKPVAKAAAKPASKSAPKPASPPQAAAKPASPPFDPTKGTATGLPLPRWASLRSDDVNLRTGPGTQYPIDWVYHRRDLPVQILREFEVWRLVQEQDGTKGWVHEATLSGRRGFVVQGGEQVLRAGASDLDAPVARVAAGVVGHVDRCPAGSDWCAVQAGDYHGWLKREALFGIAATESIP